MGGVHSITGLLMHTLWACYLHVTQLFIANRKWDGVRTWDIPDLVPKVFSKLTCTVSIILTEHFVVLIAVCLITFDKYHSLTW